MIVSVNRGESQIWPVYKVKVLFNGRELKTCVFADDKLGYADILVKDAADKFILNHGEIKRQRLYGDVEIRVGDDV